MLRTTYNALSVKLTVTLKVYDGCERSKAKSHAVREKTYIIASHPVERILVDTTGPFLENLIGNWYWIIVVDNYSLFSWNLFLKTKYQLPKKIEGFFENMTSRGAPVKYLSYDNAREQQSKLQIACKKEKVTLEYTTPHTPQMNGVIERIFAIIKEGELAMMLNVKLNDTAQKIPRAEYVHVCKRVRNSMATTDSTTSLFRISQGENPKIIGLFLEFGCIGYVTKRENSRSNWRKNI